MLNLVYAALGLPLVGFLLLMTISSFCTRKQSYIIGCGAILSAFACFGIVLVRHILGEPLVVEYALFEWVHLQKINVAFTIHFDALALLMSLIVTGVGFLIHVYSIGYMEEEEDHARYFACMNFFIFAMLLLVLAGDLIVLFMGWEGVGLASYLLIGFWYTRLPAAYAAKKAFIINRIGDFGLLLGIVLTFYYFGTTHIATILQKGGAISVDILTIITGLYFIGAIGKSAQLPLFTWLPDAMEGPTPVSALIHAATMVTAGVYLIVRMYSLFMLTPLVLQVVGIVGGITALFAAICATAQVDLKRVLAYSTISQLGFMFLACGAGAFYAAIFHLTTHAFIKALLFLTAGNVVHMLHGNTLMSKMGGLSKRMPKTNYLFFLGVLSLSGLPPLAAFFSKDLILEQVHAADLNWLFYAAFVASVLTAIYCMRAYCLVFTGRASESALSAKEAPLVMLIPALVLALLDIFGGFLEYNYKHAILLQQFLDFIILTPVEAELQNGLKWTDTQSVVVASVIASMLIVAWIYTRPYKRFAKGVNSAKFSEIVQKAFFINEFYYFIFVRPLKACAKFVSGILEPQVFTYMLQWIGTFTQKFAIVLQSLQSGQTRSYVAWIVLGATFLICFLVL